MIASRKRGRSRPALVHAAPVFAVRLPNQTCAAATPANVRAAAAAYRHAASSFVNAESALPSPQDEGSSCRQTGWWLAQPGGGIDALFSAHAASSWRTVPVVVLSTPPGLQPVVASRAWV